jgi:hypothetical protein
VSAGGREGHARSAGPAPGGEGGGPPARSIWAPEPHVAGAGARPALTSPRMRTALLVLVALASSACAAMEVGESRRNVTAFCVGADGSAYAIATQVSSGHRKSDRVCRRAVANMQHDPEVDLPCRMMEFTIVRDR